MKNILIVALLIVSANAKWEMFNGQDNHTYIFNQDTGEIARYFRNVDGNSTQEGFYPLSYYGDIVLCSERGVGKISGTTNMSDDTYSKLRKTQLEQWDICAYKSKK